MENKYNPISDKEINRANIEDAKKYLGDTDYKDLPNYKPKAGEVLSEIISERETKREDAHLRDKRREPKGFLC